MTKARTPNYLKRVKFSLSLPAWQRALLPHIDAKSNSRAATLLINAAIRSGALHTLAPGLPNHLTDPGALAAYLTSQATQPHNAAPTQAQVETPTTLEAFATWDDPEPTQQSVVAILDQAATPAQAPVTQSIWDKPADQLSDADLRELQRQAEASFLLNRPG